MVATAVDGTPEVVVDGATGSPCHPATPASSRARSAGSWAIRGCARSWRSRAASGCWSDSTRPPDPAHRGALSAGTLAARPLPRQVACRRRPGTAMKAVICEESARLCRQVYRDGLRAVVLAGSLARDEGTFVETKRGRRLWRRGAPAGVRRRHRTAARGGSGPDPRADRGATAPARLRAEIALSAVGRGYLRRLPPSIFAYELRASGEAVAGEASVLGSSRVRGRRHSREDACGCWRIDSSSSSPARTSSGGAPDPVAGNALSDREALPRHDHVAARLRGAYAPTYLERADNLARLANWSGPRRGRFRWRRSPSMSPPRRDGSSRAARSSRRRGGCSGSARSTTPRHSGTGSSHG